MSEPTLDLHDYRRLMGQIPVMIWRASPNAARDYFNEHWLAFTGRQLDQELGSGWTRGVHPEHLQRCLDSYMTAVNQRRIFEVEYRLRRQDGSFRWVRDRGLPFDDTSGAFAGYLGTCIDVDDTVAARATLVALRQAELRQLRGMLPLCAACKSVRDDAGGWQTLEAYVAKHAAVDFSHGLCPTCATRSLAAELGDPA
jgi:PAS domain S-box-containing protein